MAKSHKQPPHKHFLIVADGYDRLPGTRIEPSTASFNVELLRSWLKTLNIRSYDTCWALDAKLKTWPGPILALGHVAHAAAIKAGKRVYKLPHPGFSNDKANDKELMRKVLYNLKRELDQYEHTVNKPKVKVIKDE